MSDLESKLKSIIGIPEWDTLEVSNPLRFEKYIKICKKNKSKSSFIWLYDDDFRPYRRKIKFYDGKDYGLDGFALTFNGIQKGTWGFMMCPSIESVHYLS